MPTDYGQLAVSLAPFIVNLVNEFKHRSDTVTEDEVAARLEVAIKSGDTKIDNWLAAHKTV